MAPGCRSPPPHTPPYIVLPAVPAERNVDTCQNRRVIFYGKENAMRKIMKRGFCLFLVAVLLAGLVPCAFADEAMPTGEVEASEAATEAAEETTAPSETAVPSESTEPPSETTKPPEATETTESETEVTEPETDPVEDAPEDAVEDDRLAAYASTVTNVLLFDKASPNYTTVLRSQVSVTYNPNGSDAAKTAYIKNLGWHFARYNNGISYCERILAFHQVYRCQKGESSRKCTGH